GYPGCRQLTINIAESLRERVIEGIRIRHDHDHATVRLLRIELRPSKQLELQLTTNDDGVGMRTQLPIRQREPQGLVEVNGLVELLARKAGVSTFVRHLSIFLRR